MSYHRRSETNVVPVVLFSGGGLRAGISTVAFIRAMKRVNLWDGVVEHAHGLSGGSWGLFAYESIPDQSQIWRGTEEFFVDDFLMGENEGFFRARNQQHESWFQEFGAELSHLAGAASTTALLAAGEKTAGKTGVLVAGAVALGAYTSGVWENLKSTIAPPVRQQFDSFGSGMVAACHFLSDSGTGKKKEGIIDENDQKRNRLLPQFSDYNNCSTLHQAWVQTISPIIFHPQENRPGFQPAILPVHLSYHCGGASQSNSRPQLHVAVVQNDKVEHESHFHRWIDFTLGQPEVFSVSASAKSDVQVKRTTKVCRYVRLDSELKRASRHQNPLPVLNRQDLAAIAGSAYCVSLVNILDAVGNKAAAISPEAPLLTDPRAVRFDFGEGPETIKVKDAGLGGTNVPIPSAFYTTGSKKKVLWIIDASAKGRLGLELEKAIKNFRLPDYSELKKVTGHGVEQDRSTPGSWTIFEKNSESPCGQECGPEMVVYIMGLNDEFTMELPAADGTKECAFARRRQAVFDFMKKLGEEIPRIVNFLLEKISCK